MDRCEKYGYLCVFIISLPITGTIYLSLLIYTFPISLVIVLILTFSLIFIYISARLVKKSSWYERMKFTIYLREQKEESY